MRIFAHHLLVLRISIRDKTRHTPPIAPPIAPPTTGKISTSATTFPQMRLNRSGNAASIYSYHFAAGVS